MRSLILITYLLLTSILEGFGQSYVEGLVVDKKGEPVPFAHIRIEGSSKGTLSNIDGAFKLNLESEEAALIISSIGYNKKLVRVSAPQKMTIVLIEDVQQLGDVVIYAVDHGKELVRKASEKIAKNYPSSGERIDGFIRETLSADSLGKDLFYVSEAQIEASKASYEKKSLRDDIKLIKGRKVLVNTDSLGIRIYAGAHLPHRFDVAIRRDDPLNLKHLDQFEYEIVDTLFYLNYPLFKVNYRSTKKTARGTLFILDEIFAVVKAEQFFPKENFNSSNLLNVNERQFLKATTTYDIHEDSLWRLNFIQYQTAFISGKGRKIYLTSLYTANDFHSQTEKIPYHERLQFGQFLLNEVSTYDSTYWDGYSVPLPSVADQNVFDRAQPEVQPESTSSFIEFVQKLQVGYGLTFVTSEQHAHSLFYNQNGIRIDQSIASSSKSFVGITSSFLYQIAGNWILGYHSTFGLGDDRLAESRFSIGYQVPVSKNSRFSINPNLQFGWVKEGVLLGSFESPGTFELSGKKFDATQIDIYSVTRSQFLVPSFALLFEKSSKLSFRLVGNYYSKLVNRNGLYLREDQGSWKRKQVFIESGEESLQITGSNGNNFERDYSLEFGVIYGF